MIDSHPGLLIKLRTQEVELCANLRCSFASELGLYSGSDNVKVAIEAEVPLVHPAVYEKAELCQPVSVAEVDILIPLGAMLVQLTCVLVQFIL